MEIFYPILAELGVLIVIALLYYLIQRYRIIRNDKIEIKLIIEECAEQLHQYIEDHPGTANKEVIEKYADLILDYFQKQDYKSLAEHLKNPPQEIPDELRYNSDTLYDKIIFHARK